jgi:hypothetical protein
LLLGACGGGGGSSDQAATSGGLITSVEAFPFGVSWAPATTLVASDAVPTGALGVSPLDLGTQRSPAQAQASAQVDAIAAGRVALADSGWLRPAALFDTTLGAHASCWSPAVAYSHHDDAPANPDTSLPAGEVSLWQPRPADEPNGACAAAEVSTQLASLSGQAHQAMLLLSALRWRLTRDTSLGMPNAGQRMELTATAQLLFQGLLGDASVTAASAVVNTDGSEQGWRLVLARGTGATSQTLELVLRHTPADADTRFAGVLQITHGFLSTDAALGCSDQRDVAGRYLVARVQTLGYNRQDEWMSLRGRSGLYCGHATALSGSHIDELASLTLSGELDPAVFLPGSSRSGVTGWRRHFVRYSSDHLVSAQTSDFLLAWQAQPLGGAGHANLIAGHTTLDTSAGTRGLLMAAGHTDDISVTDGTLQGLICNVNGPNSHTTLHAAFQLQQASLARNGSGWTLTSSHHRYAPTNTCSASANMRYDADGSGSVGTSEGASTQPDLALPSQAELDVQGELNLRGFLSPVLLL